MDRIIVFDTFDIIYSNANHAQFRQAGHVCGDDNDLIDGIPTGSIRISMGYMTTIQNVEAVLDLIKNCFLNKERRQFLKPIDSLDSANRKIKLHSAANRNLKTNVDFKLELNKNKKIHSIDDNKQTYSQGLEREENRKPLERCDATKNAIKLHEICIYPIKSCAPFRVDSTWTINRRGLKYDREWMIVRSTGVAVTQKSDTKLCLIQPTINEVSKTMTLSFPYAEAVCVPLQRDINDNKVVSSFCQSKVCGDRIDGIDCGDEVAAWLDDILCASGLRLIQQNSNDKRSTKSNGAAEQAISLSNQAQFLLINVASVDWLTKKVENWRELDDVPEKVLQNTIDRFRANLIIESACSLEESDWKSIRIGNVKLFTTGPCTRCQMICIDQSTGEKTTEPLQTIAREFNGKMRFGIYLCQDGDEQLNAENDIERTISCGDSIEIE